MDLLYEEQPIVMFDTHPEPAAGLLWNAFDRFKKHMTTAWTGVPYWQVSKGQLRLLWLTADGKEGKRDYELIEAAAVRDAFDELSHMPEVRRVMVLGFPSQNPYTNNGIEVEDPKKALMESGYKDFVPASKRVAATGPPPSTTPIDKTVLNNIDNIIDADDKASKQQEEKSYGQEGV